jgi:hypothetical protein
MSKYKVGGFVEAKGTQHTLTLAQAEKIVAGESRDAIIHLGPIAKKAKDFLEEAEVCYVENVSLDDVMNYDILAERAENSTRRKYEKRKRK